MTFTIEDLDKHLKKYYDKDYTITGFTLAENIVLVEIYLSPEKETPELNRCKCEACNKHWGHDGIDGN